jgi:hypothetical protein
LKEQCSTKIRTLKGPAREYIELVAMVRPTEDGASGGNYFLGTSVPTPKLGGF